MSEIAAVSRSLSAATRNAGSILALKLQLQQEQAAVALVEKALDSSQPSDSVALAGARGVDIVV